jgi:hypothetical protein
MPKLILTNFLLLMLCSTAFAQREAAEPLRVERLSAAHWRVTVTNNEPRVLSMPGQPPELPPYASVLMPGYETRLAPGYPALPLRALAFGLPTDAALRVRVSDVREESFDADLDPLGGITIEEKRTGYTEILPVVDREGQRTGGLRILPARYDAASRRLHWLRSCVIDIRIDGAEESAAAPRTVSLSHDGPVNIDDAVNWMQRPGLAKSGLPASSLRAGEELLRIATREEGMHRVTHADLLAAGLDPPGIDPALLRLTLMGREIPLELLGTADGSFDAGDELRFHAPRKMGESVEYFDEWVDENVFLLAWNGAPGARWGDEDVAPASHPSAVPLAEFPTSLHLEEDREYHRGDLEYSDMLVSDRVLGEGWMWGYLLKRDGQQKQDSIRRRFDAAAVTASEGRLRILARGASRDTSMLRATINGTFIGEQRVVPYQYVTAEWTIPAGLLRATDNELVITNPGIIVCPTENPACSIERFYVDWARIHYSTDLSSARLPLRIDASARFPGATPPAAFRIAISDNNTALQGFELLGGRRLVNIERAGGEARMALDSSGRYFLYSEADILSPVSVARIRIPDYSAGATQVDYLVVTHRNFIDQANRLADHRRQGDGYTTLVADVDDIYNAYNYGHKSPRAIRAFVEDAWTNWPQPRPRFLLIMGDASWDAKQRKESSTKRDFVPAYGNPVSDNYYVSFTPQVFDVTPSLAVGRIPAETPEQADAVIDKIISYESQPPQPWDDRFLFSVGGENPFEQDVQLRPLVDGLIELLIEPHCIEPRLIIKKTLDFVSYDDLDTLIHEVNQGVAWFFFVGHGGTRVIDVGVERPDIFDNEDKYIFFVTMSCNTAHYAEPFETGLNERFTMSPRNGAIATLGTSGLGIIHVDYRLSRRMIIGMLDSAVRTYGEIVMLGKRGMLASFGVGDQTAINTANQVTLLGDPATRIPLARTPELAVRDGDIDTDPEILVEGTSSVIRTLLHNDGLCMEDSVGVELTVSLGGTVTFRELRWLPPFPVDTLLEWNHDFAGIDGSAEIRVTIDGENAITEKDESNNTAVLTVNVLPRGITQIFPLDRAVLDRGVNEMAFLLANPTFVPDVAFAPQAEIQYASDPAFTVGVTTHTVALGIVFTRIMASLPTQDGVWYWRARLRTTAGPERWSPVRSFTLQSVTVSDEVWTQTESGQFAMTHTEALENVPSGGVALGARVLDVEAASGGFNGPFKHSVLRIGGQDVSINRRGFNLAVVEPVYGRLVDTVHFDTYEGRSVAAQMALYINGIPDDHILMLSVRDDANGYPPSSPDGTNISPELKNVLRAYGASLIDSVGFRDSYVLIGRRSEPASVLEEHFVLGTAMRRDTFIVRATEGRLLTPVIGPANSISALRWEGTPGGAQARVDLRVHALGGSVGGMAVRDSLLAEYISVAPGTEISLAGLNPLPSAFLRVEALLTDEKGGESPVLSALHLGYVSRFPELGITSQVVESEPDSVLEGETVTVRATVYNGGRAVADGRRVRLGVPGSGILLDQPLPSVANRLDEGVEVEFSLPTAGLRGGHSLELAIDAGNMGAEYYRANNIYSKSFSSGRDGEAPTLDVTFDGTEIVNNDFVSPRPVIEIRLRDRSPLPITDTSSVQLFLDGRRIWLMSDARVLYVPGGGEEKLRIEFTPELADGLHFLAVSGKDATGNAADTIPYQVRFNVSRSARVDQIIPYPSPTAGPVDFTFRMIGAEAPDKARVKIYTVAGRLIREIEVSPGDLRIGFNRIPWDGRDGDGDAIANGVYFFKLLLSVAGENIEQVGRIAVLR